VEVYATDEERVEALRKWWKENWRSIFGGVALGLGLVFGWKAWVAHTTSVGEQASVHFEQMMNLVQTGQDELANQQAERLRSEFSATPYAVFAALLQSKMRVEQGDAGTARASLEWALNNTDEEELRHIIRLRLGRVLLQAGDIPAASGMVAGSVPGAFAGEYAELEGDIAVAKGEVSAARAAYARALQGEAGNRALIQMKLDDLLEEGPPPSVGS